MEYKKMLILAYFKDHYKKYDLVELKHMMGMTQNYFTKIMDNLLEQNLLIIISGYIVLSKNAELLLLENRFDKFKFDEINTEKNERMDINEPYVPVGFSL